MVEGMTDEAFVEAILLKLDEFNFGDEEECAEAVFGRFAKEHHHMFDAECNAEESENKLE